MNTLETLKEIWPGPFWVRDYKSTTGNVSDILVRQETGVRKRLALESLEQIKDNRWALALGEMTDSVKQARDEVIASLELAAGIRESEKAAVERASKEKLAATGLDGFKLLDEDPTKIVLFDLEEIERVTKEVGHVPVSRNEVTALKKKIIAGLPVRKHLFRLNLYPDSFGGVEPA